MIKRRIEMVGFKIHTFCVTARALNVSRTSNQCHWKIQCENCGAEKVAQGAMIRLGRVGKCTCSKQSMEQKKTAAKIRKIQCRIAKLEQELVRLTTSPTT